jgi:hypothetical protein
LRLPKNFAKNDTKFKILWPHSRDLKKMKNGILFKEKDEEASGWLLTR